RPLITSRTLNFRGSGRSGASAGRGGRANLTVASSRSRAALPRFFSGATCAPVPFVSVSSIQALPMPTTLDTIRAHPARARGPDRQGAQGRGLRLPGADRSQRSLAGVALFIVDLLRAVLERRARHRSRLGSRSARRAERHRARESRLALDRS